MSPGDALRFRSHHVRLMGTRLLREDPSRRKPPFVQIPLNPDKCDISNINIQMSPGMLCGSNDTTFASWGPVCSEKTPPDENHHLSKFL